MATRETQGVRGNLRLGNTPYILVAEGDSEVLLTNTQTTERLKITANQLRTFARGSSTQISLITESTREQLQLDYDFYESASGHKEVTSGSKLVPGTQDSIVFVEYHEDLGFLPGMSNTSEYHYYRLFITDLVVYFRENGL